MGFPRPAPMKPRTINWGARFGLTGALVAWTVGFWAVAEFYFDLFRPIKEKNAQLHAKNDPRFLKEQIRRADEEAMRNIEVRQGYSTVNAAQFREAKQRFEEAQFTNEVREFFMKKQDAEVGEHSGNEDNYTNLDNVKPGVYGKVIVTRSVEKEREIDEAKKVQE